MPLALLTLLLSSSLALCPYNCSSHGDCLSDVCRCFPPWLPPFCSVFDAGRLQCPSDAIASSTPLNPGDAVAVVVRVASPAQSLAWHGPNLALFAAWGAAASQERYDFTGVDDLLIPDARTGDWHLLAVATSNLSIPLLSLNCSYVCPNNCSNQGVCNKGTCECDADRFEPDCSMWMVNLAPQTPFTWKCDAGGALGPLLQLSTRGLESKVPQLQLQLVSGSATVLASRRVIPSRVSFDMRLSGAAPQTQEAVGPDAVGNWRVALEECTSGNATMVFEWKAACPNDCHSASGRGQCDVRTASCQCLAPYRLPDCSSYEDALADGESRRAALLLPLQRHLYILDVFSAASSGLRLSLSSSSSAPAPVTLLLRASAPPSLDNYDAAALTNGSAVAAVVEAGWQFPLLPGPYWAAVVAPPGGPTVYPLIYNLSMQLSHTCPGRCGGPSRGKCLPSGVCQCFVPFVLGDCSALLLPATPDQQLSGAAVVSSWSFFSIVLHSGNAVRVSLEELAAPGGQVWLFVQFLRLPSLQFFLAADVSSQRSHVVLIRSRDVPDNATLYIGVYGGPNMRPSAPPVPYALTVTTGCQTYTRCSLCVSDPDCGWCFNSPFNRSAGICLAGVAAAPFVAGVCGTWAFSKCDISQQQANVLNLGILVGVLIGTSALLVVAVVGYVLFRRVQSEEDARLSRLQNLDAPQRPADESDDTDDFDE